MTVPLNKENILSFIIDKLHTFYSQPADFTVKVLTPARCCFDPRKTALGELRLQVSRPTLSGRSLLVAGLEARVHSSLMLPHANIKLLSSQHFDCIANSNT